MEIADILLSFDLYVEVFRRPSSKPPLKFMYSEKATKCLCIFDVASKGESVKAM